MKSMNLGGRHISVVRGGGLLERVTDELESLKSVILKMELNVVNVEPKTVTCHITNHMTIYSNCYCAWLSCTFPCPLLSGQVSLFDELCRLLSLA